ncbi:MAG TPA: serine/threonine-protein kinase [Gemmatimonadales bacterium]|nr:serine/threonine-protein kinase [Gemmatimonadales bacterium]
MAETKRMCRKASSTPAELKSTPGHRRQLPPDLLRQASSRLQILALIGATLWILGPGLGHLALYLTTPEDPRWAQFGTTDAIAAVEALIGLGLFGYLRSRYHDPAFILDLALVYMVLCAAGIALMFHLGPPGVTPMNTQPMISWIGPVILMFAALAPGSPWKMLVAGFVATSMDPLGMVIAQSAGHYHYGEFHHALIMHYPSYLLLGVAVVISHAVTRLGQQVTKEREMGSYRLGELLGRGGMGEVYKATHRMLARPAAIKLIQPEVLATRNRGSAQVAVARFRREAEAAAKLRSPHTVELYDFGVTEDGGALYLVMEFLEGMDLETLVRSEGPLPQKRVIHILRQVCESLEEAHAAGLVHRDIKPANIHIGRVGLRHDFVKVLDFGLVKSMTAPPGEDSMATAAGLTPGTPAYLAPEMALGEAVDGRADLYALGCVAYFILTGQLVFEAGSGLQMIAKHIQETPDPPSRRAELDIAPALDRVVLACLAKRREDRPASAAEVDRMLAEIEIAPWSEEDATRWWKQHQPQPA